MYVPKRLMIGLVAVLALAVCFPASAKKLPKVDNFLFVVDASGSMRDTYMGQGVFTSVTGVTSSSMEPTFKIHLAKEAMLSMNQAIPELDYQAGLFSAVTGFQTFMGMQAYDTTSMEQAIGSISAPPRMYGFNTPMAKGLGNLESVLQGLSGKTAVILLTDGGANLGGSPAPVVKRLGKEYNTCFHIVSYAQSAEEKQVISDLAQAMNCSVLISGLDIQDQDKMQGFVHRVFYTSAMDSDGDGVYNQDDQCPGTPAGVEVDDVGCPLDSDMDGVPNYKDFCPNTPRGMQVNAQGCPDSDGDGVYDNVDQCPDTVAGAEVDDVGCPFPVRKKIKVLFDFDKAVVKDTYHSEIRKIADYLKRNPETSMRIEGYTDSIGPADYNMGLSQRRADSVKSYLVNKLGVDADRLQTKGYGESNPVADNSTKYGRQQNRRVIGVVTK